MFGNNFELPKYVRSALPESAQTRFRMAANKAQQNGKDARGCIHAAWSEVAQAWQCIDGNWRRRPYTVSSGNPFHGDKGHLTGNPSYRSLPTQPDNPAYNTLALGKAAPRTMYVCRPVVNANDIIDWAKAQGFKTTVPADQMHVTIAHSSTPVDWVSMGNFDDEGDEEDEDGNYIVPAGGPRLVEPLGPNGAVVLLFASDDLACRHWQMRRDGASWDWPSYQPHITITTQLDLSGNTNLSDIIPYQGQIVLGPEQFKEVTDNAMADVVEKVLYEQLAKRLGWPMVEPVPPLSTFTVLKVDPNLGLVFGWAIISKIDGQDYYDRNVDRMTGERVPEHIPEQTMLESGADFMENSRMAKEMHDGDPQGTCIFAFPLTTEIAKAMGITSRVSGLMVALKPSPEMLKKFVDGELKGFSIGGTCVKAEDLEV